MNFRKNTKGITLIALVVTIIVLLILVGVTLSLVVGSNGIINKASKAVDESEEATAKEELEVFLAECKAEYYAQKYEDGNNDVTLEDCINAKITDGKYITASGGEITFSGDTLTNTKNGVELASLTTEGTAVEKVEIPEGLEIGAIVSYTPSGTYSEWTTAHSGYSTSYSLASGAEYNSADTTLTDMTISSWKVFKIDEITGEVQLVPSSPTTQKVGLYGANGYNNAIKLLNDACSSLYGKAGVRARSINIEDIESVLNYDLKTYSTSYASYGKQMSTAHTDNKQYPNIYAEEVNSVITPAPEGKNKTLGLSDSANDWVTGSSTATTSIQPYQTDYFLSNSDFSSKLNGEYSDLLLPSGSGTQYWVASRCVQLNSSICGFSVYNVGSGNLNPGSNMFESSGRARSNACPLFPVVSLSSELLEEDTTNDWRVK